MRTRMNGKRMPARQHGAVAVLVALFLLALLGFGALALDLGRVFVVRNQLQNAADAAALAGAGVLSGPGGATYTYTYINPNWAQARENALLAVKLNGADGRTLVEANVTTGYWNVTGNPALLQPSDITPGLFDKPAVQVEISRSEGNNGGPLKLFLASALGVPSLSFGASAVAVISPPGYAAAGSLFPVAIAQCLHNNHWDSINGRPINNDEFEIPSSYHDGDDPCSSGAWTTFKEKANNVPDARYLMAHGNSDAMSIRDKTWIEPGTKNTLFSSVPVPSDVLLPVVTDIKTNSDVTIVAFAPFHITAVDGGAGKYIRGYFIANYKAPRTGAGPGDSPYFGAHVPPVLAR